MRDIGITQHRAGDHDRAVAIAAGDGGRIACASDQDDDVAVEAGILGQSCHQPVAGHFDRGLVRGAAHGRRVGRCRQCERQLERVFRGQRMTGRGARVDSAVALGIAIEGRENRGNRDPPVVALRLEQLPVAQPDDRALAGLQVAEVGGVQAVALRFDQHGAVAALHGLLVFLVSFLLRLDGAGERAIAERELQPQQHGARRHREGVDDLEVLVRRVGVVLFGGDFEQRGGGTRLDAHALEHRRGGIAGAVEAGVLFVGSHGFRSLRMVA